MKNEDQPQKPQPCPNMDFCFDPEICGNLGNCRHQKPVTTDASTIMKKRYDISEADLEEVRSELAARDQWENCEGHSHDVAGIWDSDNGDKAGTICELCQRWNEFPALNARIAELEREKTILSDVLVKDEHYHRLKEELGVAQARVNEAADKALEYATKYSDCTDQIVTLRQRVMELEGSPIYQEKKEQLAIANAEIERLKSYNDQVLEIHKDRLTILKERDQANARIKALEADSKMAWDIGKQHVDEIETLELRIRELASTNCTSCGCNTLEHEGAQWFEKYLEREKKLVVALEKINDCTAAVNCDTCNRISARALAKHKRGIK